MPDPHIPHDPQDTTHAMPQDPEPQAPPARRADPGTPTSRLFAVVAAIVCAASAILWQNMSVETQSKLLGVAPPAVQSQAVIDPVSQVGLLGRVYIRLDTLYRDNGMPMGQMAMPYIDQSAMTHAERIAAGIAAGRLIDADAAIERLEKEREALLALTPDDIDEQKQADLLLDTKHLLALYNDQDEFVSDDARARLERRYPYFGKLAVTHGLPDTDPERAPLLSGAMAIILVLLAIGAGAVLVFFAGSILLLVGWLRLSSGRLRFAFRPPAPGGSVFLEIYALFVGVFLVFSIATTRFETAALYVLAIQWTLLLIPLWPLLRGMDGASWRQALGLHTGRGVLREIGAGLTVYLASVPLFFLGVLLTFVLMILQEVVMQLMGAGAPEPPDNPIVDLVEQANPFALAMIFLLACVWAPLTEEMVFRGALYRALRGRLRWVWAGLISALLFAFMHSYGPLMVSPLVALGFMFCFMREWRGSLIASMTAHFTHNATVLTIAGVVVYLIY
ncbi:MAG: CPBP family glutamic-type intramembrane protease [Phycisphaerales bacterium]